MQQSKRGCFKCKMHLKQPLKMLRAERHFLILYRLFGLVEMRQPLFYSFT